MKGKEKTVLEIEKVEEEASKRRVKRTPSRAPGIWKRKGLTTSDESQRLHPLFPFSFPCIFIVCLCGAIDDYLCCLH